ncbi:MAG: DUF58 domain-containing protein [Myxococcales bacterium]|jgi:uncharacterized protein (DUF58 family)
MFSAHPAARPRWIERMREERRRRRRLRFTREGWYYSLFTLGVGIAALNTGNNLLFLVLGLQLAAILISGVLSESAVLGLQIERVLPADPAAGDRFAVTYRVRNHKRHWPSFTLSIAEKDGPFAGQRASVLYVGPDGGAEATLHTSAPRRGRFRLDKIVVSTRFPFGFFEKYIHVSLPDDLYVVPARVRPLDRRARGGYRDGERPEGRLGRGAELHGLREARAGDDRRFIHWRKSAAVGRLLVIEREHEQRRRVVLVVDNRGPQPADWLERPLEQAAAVARLLCGRGLAVGLATSGEYLPPAPGPVQLKRLLRRLAELAPADSSGPAPDPKREGALAIGAGGGAA